MKNEKKFRKVISAVSNFFVFFLLAAFVTTCCIMLFVSALQNSMGREFTRNEITLAAKMTMVNVVLISVAMVTIDFVRRKIMVDRPTKKITEATEKITAGDFSVRIKPMQSSGMEGFNQIAEAINQMAAELSSVETLRTDFIANVSHEMKTPLAVMQNYGTLLQAPDLSEEKRLEYARAELSKPNASVTKISEHLNFTDVYTFSKFFKMHTGMAPMTYKAQISGDSATG